MQIFCFVLFPVILAVAHAGDTTILETLFQIPDANANGAWEIGELMDLLKDQLIAIGTSLFEELDTNGDIRITLEEVKEFCVELLESIFKLNDPNGDGFISSVELISGDAAIEPNIEILAILFRVLDVNQDGFLSTEDVFPQGLPNHLVDYMDVNHDGIIGIQEYNSYSYIFLWPKAPTELVKLYRITDKNTDDKFTLEEIQDVLRTSLAIMDEDSDGIVSLEEQLHALTQVGLSQDQAEIIRVKWQMSRSSDMANKIIDIMDTDNDNQVSQDEVTDILEYPYNSLKFMELAILAQEMSESNANDNFQLEPEHTLSGQQALDALRRFLNNPRFN